ncbi:acyl-protein thioesterase 1 [Chaetomidium leptoderma]|uniref:Acyl-protein thioesterase 1 n=1 Tax=Chaetomidium leptoderma TaxID=669021 RepID=A0AAN6ZS93_9PEZI|nr:acyl-protein thioesterase 1 [Chaetomidium leptoderma]
MPPFGPVHVLEPQAPHTHTIIFLHGRGSTGEDTAFDETMPAWFQAHSLTDVTARQDLQMIGIRESVRYLTRLLDEETEKLGGAADRVLLGGISQGAAVGLWTLLCAGESTAAGRLGGFVGASTWLPFAENLERYLGGGEIRTKQDTTASNDAQVSKADAFVEAMTASARGVLPDQRGSSEPALHSVPVFLAHGTDDAYVDIELGRQAAHVLRKVGLKTEWREYSGADQEGHWLKEPEEFDDIVRFLESTSASI